MATPAALVAVVVNVDHTVVVDARRCNCTDRTTPTPPVVTVTACDTGKPTAADNADEDHPDTTVTAPATLVTVLVAEYTPAPVVVGTTYNR